MIGLDTWAKSQPGRCAQGFAPIHHPTWCACAELGEWSIFVAAVRRVVRSDGTVHQSDMRPLIRGRIASKHIASLYRQAKTEGLLVDTGEREQSDDVIGRNTDKLDRIYRLADVAASTGRAA